MKTKLFLFLTLITLLPGGCTLAPKYERPAAPVPAEWPKGAAYQAPESAASTPAAAELKWREFFTDERLQKIIETALNNNRDLRLAALNVEKARALYGIQRAELLCRQCHRQHEQPKGASRSFDRRKCDDGKPIRC